MLSHTARRPFWNNLARQQPRQSPPSNWSVSATIAPPYPQDVRTEGDSSAYIMPNRESRSDTALVLTKSMVAEILDKSVSLLQTKCIRLNGVAPDWERLFAKDRKTILECDSVA